MKYVPIVNKLAAFHEYLYSFLSICIGEGVRSYDALEIITPSLKKWMGRWCRPLCIIIIFIALLGRRVYGPPDGEWLPLLMDVSNVNFTSHTQFDLRHHVVLSLFSPISRRSSGEKSRSLILNISSAQFKFLSNLHITHFHKIKLFDSILRCCFFIVKCNSEHFLSYSVSMPRLNQGRLLYRTS